MIDRVLKQTCGRVGLAIWPGWADLLRLADRTGQKWDEIFQEGNKSNVTNQNFCKNY